MAWAKIEDLIQVDNEVEITTERFSIPAGGSDPNNQGNSMVDILFYKEDIEKLLAQVNADGLRLVNTFLNTPALGANKSLPLTFTVAIHQEGDEFTSLSQPDDVVAITCPPVYIRNAGLGFPLPGSRLLQETIRMINTNRY